MPGEGALGGNRGKHSLAGVLEGDEEGVSLRVDLVARVLLEHAAKKPGVVGEHLAIPSAQHLHQRRRRLDVGEQERDCAARQLRQVERAILLENRLFEALQRRSRLEPQLIDERLPCLLVRVQGFALPARAVEREHQLSSEALPQGMLRDQRLQLADEIPVPAE
jgi:hypothetical protein